MNSLVQKLFTGSTDVVGDVHGDIDALRELLSHLDYDSQGNHADSRRLVFVGDLTDRGPDSVAVVRLVQKLVELGKAQCLLGNHELNIMLGERKFDNGWFFGERFFNKTTGGEVKQHLVTDKVARNEIVDFFKTLPLVLESDEVRVVHACWEPDMVAMASAANDVVELYKQNRYNIDLGLALRSELAGWHHDQRHQNLNPVKVLTSGLEIKIDEPFEASGKIRYLERYPWWRDYDDEQYCFFGHYSQPYGTPRVQARAICVDYGVARRWVAKAPGDDSPHKWRLAAIRYPEMQVVFDDGYVETIRG